jgi:hypothetical protein
MLDQRYRATREFEVTSPVSGRKRRTMPDDIFFVELLQHGPTVTIQIDESLWLVERTIFEQCCIAYGGPVVT